jgi:exopolysaccharide production protein ExoZ
MSARVLPMDGLRAYAAGIVFLFHSALLMQEHQHLDGPIVDWMLHSQYGVDVFFILSGYLISGLVARPGFEFGKYLVHRVARIYPALLAMFALCIVGLVVVRHQTIALPELIANLLLVNGPLGLKPLNNVTWSLMYEFAFYLSFPPLYRKFGLRGAALITAVALVPLAYHDMNYLRMMFFYAGAWMRLTTDRPKLGEAATVALYVAVTTLTVYLDQLWLFTLAFLPASAWLVDRLLHADGPVARFLSQPWLRVGGNLSYSFYLFHPIGLFAAQMAANRAGVTGWTWAGVLLATGFIVSLGMAAGSYYALERPYFNYRQRKATT